VSVSQTRYSNLLVLLRSCAQGLPTPLSILVRARLRSSVKGVVHKLFVSSCQLEQSQNAILLLLFLWCCCLPEEEEAWRDTGISPAS
jgi:hypothetical protein